MRNPATQSSPASVPAAAPADSDTTALLQFIMGFRLTQMVHVAAKLELADHLREQPRTPDHLAQAVGADAGALARLLRALASVGVFRENVDATFALTPRASLLCRDSPGSLHRIAVLYGEDWLWRAYGRTLHAVRTGEPGFDEEHDASFYSYLHEHPAAAAVFDDAMSGCSALEVDAIRLACDFTRVDHVLDVGGGRGALVATLLQAHPRLRATVFELPGTAAEARQALAHGGFGDRCGVEAGDFFVAVPPSDGAVLLKSVLHNWSDAKAGLILRNCQRAMRPGARLLIAERVIEPGNGASAAKLFDINMLVVVGGQERSAAQYRALLAEGGFELVDVRPTRCALSLVEAVRL